MHGCAVPFGPRNQWCFDASPMSEPALKPGRFVWGSMTPHSPNTRTPGPKSPEQSPFDL